ncbi:uncharacterized protein LOC132299589 isoform X2 [Cornus florida]|uniref:uncharacterized protein LOC132299589 isoform X2 n=1 Tax=Cornus florida TaxID=4283 RepID=UPI00289AAA93|nr:uncharacterized protein LOC132299589 isoform X2 [Cornus florida]
MARVPSKHGRDQALDFEGFLNDLQDWELSRQDKDKKLKPEATGKQKLERPMQRGGVSNANQKIGMTSEDKRIMGKTSSADYSSTARHDYSGNLDSIGNFSSSFMTEESSPDAASEKELGNEYFKQKKFKEAIDCYSRSIALSPTAVAYANRAMAYLKIKRFQEAEDDCTEALNLDDRYIKAYSRRATARKELGKLKESIEDAEFALRLEPQNQEIKKQYAESKSLYEKEIFRKASGAFKSSKGVQSAGKPKVGVNGHVQPVSSGSPRTRVAPIQGIGRQAPVDTSVSIEDSTSNNMITDGEKGAVSHEGGIQNSLEIVKKNQRTGKQELMASLEELASRAASRANAEAAKNITPPNSAYQFEVSWRGLSGDRALQTRLLMTISPVALPRIFKNALSAPLLIDIIKCIATFFSEEMDLAIKYLENLTKVSRFDMLIMCLSSNDRADLVKIWDEEFCSKAASTVYSGILAELRPRYGLKE